MSESEAFDSPPRPAKRRKTAEVATTKTTKPKAPRARKTPKAKENSDEDRDDIDDFVVDDEDALRAKRPVKAKPKARKKVISDDEEDGFEAPPKAAKSKPRTRKKSEAMDEYDSITESDLLKPKKPKHRIHTPAIQVQLPETFLGDGPPPSTCPWEIRGPIWRKESPAAKPTISPTTSMGPPKAPLQQQIPEARNPRPESKLPSRTMLPPPPRLQPFPVPAAPLVEEEQSEMFDDDFDIDELDAPLAKKTENSMTDLNKPRPNMQSAFDLPTARNPHETLSHSAEKPKNHDLSEIFGSDDDDALQAMLAVEAPVIRKSPLMSSKNALNAQQPATIDLSGSPPRLVRPAEKRAPASVAAPVVEDELADLPLDAFDSSPTSSPRRNPNVAVTPLAARLNTARKPNMAAPQNGLRQTTLFGTTVQPMGPATQATKKHAWPLATQKEAPTHHEINEEAMQTWVYPTNLGTIRDYQYNIVARGLFHNLLVALPTGLGKTFIAATVMLNWFRWTKSAQIVFVAPTKPLVAQQIDACFNIVGIPRSETVMLTGTTPPGLRAEEWKEKRVFFMTPQTIINDLKTGMCDPKRIVLLVVDEAHRATGGYAYVEVVKFLRRFNQSFRVLALTATPGASVEAVQQVIDGLDISRVEIRTETSLDIRQYVHARDINTETFDYSDEQQMIFDLLSNAIKPVLSKLNGQNAYWLKDPMKLTAFGCTQALRQWHGSDAGKKAPHPIKGMVMSIFTVLASLAHGISLLKFHGIGPFLRSMTEFRNKVDGGELKGKYGAQIRQDENFGKMLTRVQSWTSNPDFLGHPKLEYLRRVVLNHFMDAGEGNRDAGAAHSATRIMIFAHWRDSAEEIVRVLKRNEPMIRPHVFVGQADSKQSEGMGQKRQLEVIQEFKEGKYNTLVATSIGEEGLDIGEVDLIVCYDASSSPIRMLQRMGRTGRKRKGNIVLLLMRDKEERDFEAAKDNYEKMQAMISSGTRFTFHDDKSPRIVPREIQPAVDKRVVEIPVENSQAELPEPKRGKRVPKRPPKVFHMPDNVRTGFVKASRMDASDDEDVKERAPSKVKAKTKKTPVKSKAAAAPAPPREPEVAPLPYLNDVLLNKVQERDLERKYQYVHDTDDNAPVITAPRLDNFSRLFPGPSRYVKHGQGTTRIAQMMQRVRDTDESTVQKYRKYPQEAHLSADVAHLLGDDNDLSAVEPEDDTELPTTTRARKPTKVQQRKARRRNSSDMEAASSSPEPTPANMRIATQGIDLGSDDTAGEEEADDEPDSELADFVVGSDIPIEVVSSSLPGTQDMDVPRRFYISQEAIAEESDGDLPELGSAVKDKVSEKNGHQAMSRRRGKRQVVEDDSDE